MGYNVTRQKNRIETFEGGRGFEQKSPMEELYLLCANSLMVSDETFYESGEDREGRFMGLLDKVASLPRGVEFITKLAVYAREELYLRSVPSALVAYALQKGAGISAHVAAGRIFVRGDEHLDALAFLDHAKQKRTKNFLRAVSERMVSLSEKQALKYTGSNKRYSQKDALCLCHAVGTDDKQRALLKYIRRGWNSLSEAEQALLPLIAKDKGGEGQTWEKVMMYEGEKGEEADFNQAWEKAIPKMGYMALLRNLVRLSAADIPRELKQEVAAKISDPDLVARSKQLPFRYVKALDALRVSGDKLFINAVTMAMDAATANIHELPGETCVVVDCSGSMTMDPEGRMLNAALLAAMLQRRFDSTIVPFSMTSVRLLIPAGTPVYAGMQMIMTWPFRGGGTMLGSAIRYALTTGEFDRMIVLTDEQAHDDTWHPAAAWLETGKGRHLFVINLAGYKPRAFDTNHPRVHSVGGFSDRVLDWIKAVEIQDPVKAILG